MVVTSRDCKVLFSPNKLHSDLKAHRSQAFSDLYGFDRRMPDVDDRTWEQTPRVSPIHAVVVHDFTPLNRFAVPKNTARLVPPSRIIVNAVGWIGDHEGRHNGSK